MNENTPPPTSDRSSRGVSDAALVSRTVGAHERIAWIDLAKGLGILLMTFGHVGEAPGGGWALPALEEVTAWIYLFHMPAFFLLGGFTYRRGQQASDFVTKKLRTLLVPYVVYSSYFLVKAVATSGGDDSVADLLGACVDVYVYGRGLWFLAAYLVGELAAYAIMDVVGLRGVALPLAGMALFAGSYAWFAHNAAQGGGLPPFELVNGLRAAGLMCVGAHLRPRLPIGVPGRRGPIAGALVLSVVAFVAAGLCVRLGVPTAVIWPFEAMASLFGSMSLALVAILLPTCAPLERVGRESLSYYVIAPEMTNLVKLPALWLIGLFPSAGCSGSPAVQWLVGVLMTAAIIIVTAPVGTLLRRHLPWTLGLRGPSGHRACGRS